MAPCSTVLTRSLAKGKGAPKKCDPPFPLATQGRPGTIYLQYYEATEGARSLRGVDNWVCLAGSSSG